MSTFALVVASSLHLAYITPRRPVPHACLHVCSLPATYCRHSFVSAYDFGPWPLLQGVSELPTPVIQVRHFLSRRACTAACV